MKRIIFILSITSALIISCNSNNAPTIGEKPLTSNVPSDDKTVREGTPLSQWNDSDANIISVNSSSVNLRAANASEYTLLDRLYSTVWYQSESDYDDGRLETEEEFNTTYQFLKRIKFYKTHIFKYSQRKGTRAAVMPNQVDGNIKEERSRKLIALSDENEREYNKKYIGKEVEVLLEEPHLENGKKYMKGHTTNYIVVKVEGEDKKLENEIKKVKIVDLDGIELVGKLDG